MTGCLCFKKNWVICLAFFWFNHDQIFSRSCIEYIFWPHFSGNRHSLYRLDTARTSIMMAQPVLGLFYWLPWVLLPCESWFWVVPPHSMVWLYWFPYRVFDAVRVKYRKGNVLGYYRNLGSLRYGNEYCVPGRAMSCTSQSLPSKKSEMRRRSNACIAIGSLNAAAETLVHLYSIAWTNGCAVTLRD